MTDRFSKTLELRYPTEDLWSAIEWWRATVASRFTAAGGEGRTSQITMWWEEGGYSDRKTAEELREFAKNEHLTPRYMHCTMRNAKFLDATVEVEFWARFYSDGEFAMEVDGSIKQQVFGLHAELLLDKDAEEARLMQVEEEKTKREAKAEPVIRASGAPSQPAPVKKPWYRSTWFWGTSVLGAIGVFIGILNFVLNVAGG